MTHGGVDSSGDQGTRPVAFGLGVDGLHRGIDDRLVHSFAAQLCAQGRDTQRAVPVFGRDKGRCIGLVIDQAYFDEPVEHPTGDVIRNPSLPESTRQAGPGAGGTGQQPQADGLGRRLRVTRRVLGVTAGCCPAVGRTR